MRGAGRTLGSALAVAVVCLATAAVAEDMEDCADLNNDLDRLACYDRVSGRTPSVSREEVPNSDWSVSTEVSPLTDETNVFLSVLSEEVVDCGWNRGGRIRLSIRCMENTTALIFVTNCHMTSNNIYGTVDYRVDDAPAAVVRMNDSTDNRALGLWRGGQSIPFIRGLFGAERLVARMTPFSENPFTVTFNITGLEEAITPLREACHW